MEITVIRTETWEKSKTNCSEGGLRCQVTHCMVNGIQSYVRENTNGINSFFISSGERWGDKTGNKPGSARQTLELFAPAVHWDEIQKIVAAADPLQRPVNANRLFNKAFVVNIFKVKNDSCPLSTNYL